MQYELSIGGWSIKTFSDKEEAVSFTLEMLRAFEESGLGVKALKPDSKDLIIYSTVRTDNKPLFSVELTEE